MVNILKAMSEIDLENDDFLTTILEAVVDNFNELKITWAITLMRTLGTMSLGNQELLLASMTEISQAMHKKLLLLLHKQTNKQTNKRKNKVTNY